MSALLDTNTILYFLAGRVGAQLPAVPLAASVISKIEALSYPAIKADEEKQVRAFFQAINVVSLDESISEMAILLRRRHRLKIPDALIAATALVHDMELVSADQHFVCIPDLRLRTITPE